ncbi:MAG: hypothetical protein H7281_06760 [Bacteriovorax sp.]|nr:hypothetical protein [Bacteriovorax sp.]
MKKYFILLFILISMPIFAEEQKLASVDNSTKKELDKFFESMLGNLLGIYANKVDALNDTELCHDSPIDRLNFIVRDIPYTNLTKFAKKCFFEGSFRNEFNKKLSTSFNVKNIFDYNKLSFDYIITKKVESGMINLNTDITNGFCSTPKNKIIKFTSIIRMTISPQEVLFSAGQSGITLEKATVDVKEYNGVAVKYHKVL